MPTYGYITAHALNQYVLADGKITLYKRDDMKGAVWQCRILIKGNRGYVRRTAGEAGLERTKELALQILGELKQRKAQNLQMTCKTFDEIGAIYLKDAKIRGDRWRHFEIVFGCAVKHQNIL